VAVHEQDVRPAVVVEVEEVDAEAEVLPVHAEAGAQAHLLEGRRRSCGRASSAARRSSCARCRASRRCRSRRRRLPSRERCAFRVEGAAGGIPTSRKVPSLLLRIEQARRRVAGHVDVRASRRCRSPPTPRPCRRTPWAASCCRRRPSTTGPRGRAIPDASETSSNVPSPCCDRARSCRRESRAARRGPGCRCRGSRRPGPASARPAGRSSGSSRRRGRGCRRGRSRGSSSRPPIGRALPRRPPSRTRREGAVRRCCGRGPFLPQ
jgi:hypothetical protein